MSDPPVAAEVVLPCDDLAATLPFFTDTLGFRLDVISPADDPSSALLSGYGLRLRLEPGAGVDAGRLRLRGVDPAVVGRGERQLVAPNGTQVELVADGGVVLPPLAPSFVVTRAGDGGDVTGRAGMRYRDLIPDRQGGRFIASLIGIPDGGPVPDYVHFHRIRFQMIFCRRGWVRVVYEDQGPPFVLEAGDCVLQPPEIRHRVLESSPGLEVVELTSPALHETFVDHELALPTPHVRAERDFGGQRFVHHQAARADWRPWRLDGFETRDLGLAAATDGLAAAHVARFHHAAPPVVDRHAGELRFLFVLEGSLALQRDGEPVPLSEGDAVVVPAGLAHALAEPSPDLELLEVALPAPAGDSGEPGVRPGSEAAGEVVDVGQP
jgi:quercetin dioxygenase-like cupin family protein